jgi:hypothetical protein
MVYQISGDLPQDVGDAWKNFGGFAPPLKYKSRTAPGAAAGRHDQNASHGAARPP